MSRSLIRISCFLSAAVATLPAFAASEMQQEKGPQFNVMLTGLITLILVLLLVIGVLGFVLRQLATVYQQKQREQKKQGGIVKSIILVLALGLSALNANAQDATPVATNTSVAGATLIDGIAAQEFYFLMGIIGLELLVILSLLLTTRVIVRSLGGKYENETPTIAKPTRKPFWDSLNSAVAIEKEKDILLDHNYDGIQELDNSLPPWWKYGFYLTIVVGVIYLYYYHAGGNGPSSYQEYMAEVQEGEEQKAQYLAKSANNIDENTVAMLDAAGIASGEKIFQTTCAACHAKDGGGGVGPNLTDDYWIHGGSLKGIFSSIKYGWADKGMKSWKDDFSPRQLAELTSYIKSLRGSKPAAPKDKQGDLYNEEKSIATDSVKTVASN